MNQELESQSIQQNNQHEYDGNILIRNNLTINLSGWRNGIELASFWRSKKRRNHTKKDNSKVSNHTNKMVIIMIIEGIYGKMSFAENIIIMGSSRRSGTIIHHSHFAQKLDVMWCARIDIVHHSSTVAN